MIVNHSLNILFSDAIYTSVIDKFHCINITVNHIEFKNPEINQRLSFLMNNNKIASIHNQCDTCQITLIPVAMLDNLYNWKCFTEGFILTFTHYTQNNPVLERLINVHNLSRREAFYALDFMLTPSIAEIAENNFRSEDTIRNHIKHIMKKMDVHNQAALMKN